MEIHNIHVNCFIFQAKMEGIKNEVIEESFDMGRFGIMPYTAVYFS